MDPIEHQGEMGDASGVGNSAPGGDSPSPAETPFSGQSVRGRAEQADSEATAWVDGLGLSTRCPQCHASLTFDGPRPLDDITCPSCGGKITLGAEETLDGPVCETVSIRRSSTFGHFELLEQIGAGSFGTVWKARDAALDRVVAVKIPRKGQLSADEGDKFLREARAAAQLQHPRIVGVHEVGLERGLIYIVSDFIEGHTLDQWLSARKPTVREATELCRKLAETLHYAHEHGVIHRDLKPGNVMIDGAGEPHIMDFGLAKRDAGEMTMTMEGDILGTPAYMSPEQAKGEGHRGDRRMDVYSLGVILFELVAGERPFRGNVRMLLKQVIEDEPPSPRKLDARIPRDLETICLKCLQKEPRRRYDTAGELADELGRVLAGEPIAARPAGRLERGWRWCRRYPALASLAAATLLLLVALAAVGMTGYVQTSRALGLAEDRAELARRAAAGEAKARLTEAEHRHLAETTVIDMYTALGLVAGERGDEPLAALWFANAALLSHFDQARQLSSQVRFQSWSDACPVPVRAFRHPGSGVRDIEFGGEDRFVLVWGSDGTAALWDLQQEEQVQFPGGYRTVGAAAWDNRGNRLAVVAPSGNVEIYGFPAGDRLGEFAAPAASRVLAYSADDRLLAVGGNSVRVWDDESGQFVTPDLPHPAVVTGLAFSADGTQLITACADGQARLFAVGAENPEPAWPPVPSAGHAVNASIPLCPQFVHNGRYAVTMSPEREVVWWDAATGREVRRVASGLGTVDSMRASPDGKVLVVHGFSAAMLFDSATGKMLGPLRHGNYVPGAAFHPDGTQLLTGSTDRTARLWSIPSGQLLHTLPHDDVRRVAFARSGRWFATAQADGLIRVWSFPPPPAHRLVPIGPGDVRVTLTADGRYMMASRWNLARLRRTARVYEVATGTPAGPHLDPNGLINSTAFSPDGRHAVTLSGAAEHSKQHAWRDVRWTQQRGRVTVWDWRSGQKVFEPVETSTEPIAAAYHPDGRLLVVVCAGGEILLMDPASGSVSGRLRHEGTASAGTNSEGVLFAPDGRRFATYGLGPNVHVWDAQSRTLHALLRLGAHLYQAAFSPDGRWLATGGHDKTLRIWDVESGELATPPMAHPNWVFTSVFSPDGERVVTACRDNTVRLWNWREARLACAAMEHTDEAFDAAFTADGRWLITVSRGGDVRLWESLTGRPVAPPRSFPGVRWSCVVPTPDGAHAIVAGSGSDLLVVDLALLRDAERSALEPSGMQALGEILSRRRVEGGGTTVLTSREWLERWQRFRSAHPDYHRFDTDASAAPMLRPVASPLAATEIRVAREDAGQWQPLELIDRPLLASGASQGFHQGRMYAWKHSGRPDAVLSLSRWGSAENSPVCHEMVSLSNKRLTAASGGTTWWATSAPGWQPRLFPEDLPVADSELERLTQMKSLAQRFRAYRELAGRATPWRLHLRPEPIYRYNDSDAGILDGAFFVFVMDEDNIEVLLVLETSQDGSAPPRWVYHIAPFSTEGLQATLDGIEVYRRPRIAFNATKESDLYRIYLALPATAAPTAGTGQSALLPDQYGAAIRKQLPSARKICTGMTKPSWSPDGTKLAVAKYPYGAGIWIFDLRDGTSREIFPAGKDPAWAPDGHGLAFVAAEGSGQPDTVCLADPRGGDFRKIGPGSWPSWSSDGTLFYFDSSEGRLAALPPQPSDAAVSGLLKFRHPYQSVSPDGQRVATFESSSLVVRSVTGELQAIRPVPGTGFGLCGWSPDGQRIAVGVYNGSRSGLWIVALDGSSTIQATEAPCAAPAWSASGSELAFDLRVGSHTEIWIVDTKDFEQLKPVSSDPRLERSILGSLRGRQKRWKEAATHYAEAFEQTGSEYPLWTFDGFRLTAVLLELGDLEGYRLACRRLLEQRDELKSSIFLSFLLKACLLSPDGADDWTEVREWVLRGENPAIAGLDRAIRGFLDFRAGAAAEAVESLKAAMDAEKQPARQAQMLIVRSMALRDLGEEAEANRLLAEAKDTVRQGIASLPEGDLGPHWNEWLMCRILLREAELASVK
jgi:eukaryotic-like serine/threonine-protein kinase